MKRLIVVALILSGCATTMSPEQMAQNVKDKNAVVGCVYGAGMYGHGVAVYVDTNKLAENTGVAVSGECQITVTGTKSPKVTP